MGGFNDKKSTVRAVALRRCTVMGKLSSTSNAGVVGSAVGALFCICARDKNDQHFLDIIPILSGAKNLYPYRVLAHNFQTDPLPTSVACVAPVREQW